MCYNLENPWVQLRYINYTQDKKLLIKYFELLTYAMDFLNVMCITNLCREYDELAIRREQLEDELEHIKSEQLNLMDKI